jgi:hypothetical protein
MRWVSRLVRLPLDDYLEALDRFLRALRLRYAMLLALSFAVSWWVYVPVHELAHALGCWLGGGEVTRLEIDPAYGAALLRRVFPFVAIGSDYAGQLTGFDTRGSDLTYLLTDFLPFVLTIFLGVPLLRSAAAPRSGAGQALRFGAALPLACAPFVSLPGDYYEMGSILVSRLVALCSPAFDPARWRSDDLFELSARLFGFAGGGTAGDAAGLCLSFVAGAALAFATYGAGVAWSRALESHRRRAPATTARPSSARTR